MVTLVNYTFHVTNVVTILYKLGMFRYGERYVKTLREGEVNSVRQGGDRDPNWYTKTKPLPFNQLSYVFLIFLDSLEVKIKIKSGEGINTSSARIWKGVPVLFSILSVDWGVYTLMSVLMDLSGYLGSD